MTDIARMSGVTQATVSRALSRPELVSPETLDRVLQAVRATGFVPNAVAGALASSKSRMVAAVVPSITNIVYSGLIHHFIELVRAAGYQTMLVEAGFSQSEEEALVESLLARRPDGILLTGVHHSPRCRSLLLSADRPVVEIWDLTETPVDVCVGFSHAGAGVAVAQYLHDTGCRIAASLAAGDERAIRRQAAFCAEFARLGHPVPATITFDGPASIARGRAGLGRLTDAGFAKGAVFCSSDQMAQGVLIEAQARGLRIPKDIAVMGFGDQDYAADLIPPLSTVRVDRSELGRRAADALLARIDGRAMAAAAIDVGFRIVPRATTRKLRKAGDQI